MGLNYKRQEYVLYKKENSEQNTEETNLRQGL